MKSWIKINEKDNVIVALKNLGTGETFTVGKTAVILRDEIKRGHKAALLKISKGENVIRYGFPIGHAIREIQPGEHVHTHNVKTNLSGPNSYTFNQNIPPLNIENRNLTLRGYRRYNGNIGIRNELWIVPTIGCVNKMAENIILRFKSEVQPQGIDAIEAFKHPWGCSELGEDHVNLKAFLGNIVKHPNAAGVLVFGLGCEENQVDEFMESLGDYDEKRVKFLIAQDVSDEIEEGVKILTTLYENAKNDAREDIPLSELTVGLKCGGSDGLSGITANPLLGAFSDFLIAQGGTTVMTEVPEMFGAETILMERAIDRTVFEKIVNLINDFKNYFLNHNQPVDENPSPGNKEGGITTLEEKSLGCTQKGGKAPVVDVLEYGRSVSKKGFHLLNAPGNDLAATPALAAAGCQMVLFTTGRGTPYGTFVPTLKISTNTPLYEKKPHWIDFNAGTLAEDKDIEKLREELIDYIISVANGEKVNNEKNNFREIALFKTGVTV